MALDKPSPDHTVTNLSRRDLFRTAGLATGGALLLGLPKFIGNWASTAEAAVAGAISTFNMFLELDGVPTGFLLAAEGGNAFADVLVDPVGPGGIQQKRPGPVRFEDIILQVPFSGDAKPLHNWITDTLSKSPIPRNGAIVYADLNFKEIKRLEFFNAMLTEVTLPAADASAPNTVSLTLRITPQTTRLAGASGKTLQAPIGAKSKSVLSSNFRLNVQGLEKACGRISKIESISARRPVTGSAVGQDRLKQPAPGVLDCSIVRITLPEPDAGPFYVWFDDTVIKGKGGSERAGFLEWLDSTLKGPVASVELGGLGIVRYAPEPVKAGVAGKTAMVQVDMYCETLNLRL